MCQCNLGTQAVGVGGLLLLLATGELAPGNVLGFCVAASNAFGLIAGARAAHLGSLHLLDLDSSQSTSGTASAVQASS